MEFEVINGVDVKAYFRMPLKRLIAYAPTGTYNGVDENSYKQFEFDQLKLIGHETQFNNNYKYGAKSSASVGVNLGIATHQGQMLFKDGKTAAIETIKKFLYDSYLSLEVGGTPEVVGDGFGYEMGFIAEPKKVSLSQTYNRSTFYHLDENSLPPFDILLVASNPDGDGILSYKEYLGVSILGTGSDESFQSLEANTAVSCSFSRLTPWIKKEA